MTFSSLGISKELIKTLEKLNFEKPYPIQEKAIPEILNNKDVLAIAKTGSGKTASYVLPLLMNLKTPVTKRNRFIRSLILVPTRELAVQVKEVVKEFSSNLKYPIKTLAVFGGVSINPQMKAMSGVDILIATPGRLLDLMDSNAVRLSDVEILILDEADKMLNLGFKAEMDKIFRLLPTRRQNLLFSATLKDDLNAITQIVLKNPVVIKTESAEDSFDTIKQLGYFVSEEKKGPLLRHLIEDKDLKQVLVFVSSVFMADKVAHKLNKNGIHATAIHGKKSQGARTEVLRKFKTGHLRVLVSTDLLARGVDIAFLPCVINYELPRSPKDYVHRIGRTGRAENPGDAISFVEPDAEHHFKIIQKKMKKKVEMIDSKNLEF
jgi:ATP-dependent RNA helicase RhlE